MKEKDGLWEGTAPPLRARVCRDEWSSISAARWPRTWWHPLLKRESPVILVLVHSSSAIKHFIAQAFKAGTGLVRAFARGASALSVKLSGSHEKHCIEE